MLSKKGNEKLSENIKNEFKFLNRSVETLGIFYGFFLILWGIVISFVSESSSLTSYIPAFLGIPILFFCFLSLKFSNLKKALMHIVVLISLIIFLGGLDFLRDIFSFETNINLYVSASKLMMLITGLFYLFICISSFRHNRKNKI